MISRRRALGYVVAASLVPLRAHADAGLPRMEVRESLAKRFADDGTAGVFVAYDPSAKALVGSDAQRAAQAIRTRPSVQEQRRLAGGVAAAFPIDPMSIADIEHIAVIGLDGRKLPRHLSTRE
jgi:hypothetical protein